MITEPRALRILVADNDPAHVEAIRAAWNSCGSPVEIKTVASLQAYRSAVAARVPHVALMDMGLSDGQAETVLVTPPESGTHPVLLMALHGDEATAVAVIKAGALDYIVKSPGAFASMPRIVERALREWAQRKGRLEVEEALRLSEQRYRLISDVTSDYMFSSRMEADGRVLLNWATGAIQRIYGYTQEEFTAIGGWRAILHPDDLAVDDQDMARLRSNQRVASEIRVRSKSGAVVWVRVCAHPEWHVKQNRLAGVYGSVQDITPRKQAERLQAAMVRILSILNRPAPLVEVVGELLMVIQQLAGFDAVGIRLRQGDDYPYFVQTGFAPEFLTQENCLLAANAGGRVEIDAQGRPALECTCGLVLSERTTFDDTRFTPAGSFWCNDAGAAQVEPVEALPRLRPRDRCARDGYRSIALVPIRAGDGMAGLLQLNDRSPNRLTPELMRFFEAVAASIGVAVARCRDEELLRQALERQTDLVKEIHHRVKNNIQIMTSLLNLQSRRVGSPEVRAALGDTQSRLRSMGLVHETLYRSGRMDRVQLNDYVAFLCDHLARSCGAAARGIELAARVPDCAMGIDQAVPCGLIITELVGNAFKHAFPGGRPGRIDVGFDQASDGSAVLRVADNGAGLPEGLDLAQVSSLGLTLVRGLARQLQGALVVRREAGAAFEVRFTPVAPPPELGAAGGSSPPQNL